MSRRKRAERRELHPDPKFKSLLISQLMNVVLRKGKKASAEQIVYTALEQMKKKLGGKEEELTLFKIALDNIRPSLEVKSRRVGGANYQVPVEVPPRRGTALALRWLRDCAASRNEKDMSQRLASELIQAFNKEGNAVRKRIETHRMADANKAFAHFRW